jgi:predicted alpha/beta superfamily hydrolase
MPDTIRLTAVDRSGLITEEPTPPLFLASNLNNWGPAATPATEIVRTPSGEPIAWAFDLPREGLEEMLFKFTRGGWETVEVSPEGSDIQDRAVADALGEGEDLATTTSLQVFVEGFADQRGTRWPDLRPPPQRGESTVTGDLRTFEHNSGILGNTRTVRVWLPPGYTDPANANRRYPVLYMHDGQNCFDAATASFGVEWGCDETATRLIEEGTIPPMLVVGIDNAGAARSAEYNAPSASFSRHSRTPTATQAIGDKYLDMLTTELMPRIERDYRVLTGPEHTAMGGSSFGGNITLYAAMRHPDLFSKALVESPAVPVVGPAFFEDIRTFDGEWPDRVFIAMGTRETDNPAYNAELVEFMGRLRAVFEESGLTMDNDRLKVVIEPDARHFEADWARRLPDAFRFLFAPRDEVDEPSDHVSNSPRS